MAPPKGYVPPNTGTGRGWVDQRGYRWVYVEENGRRVARREHRVLLERSLGRKLEPWELVHHRDGDPANNELSNLEITNWGDHAVEHHTDARRKYESRRSMEAFALMREQLKREREMKSELLEALRKIADRLTDEINGFDGHPGHLISMRALATAAIEKATK